MPRTILLADDSLTIRKVVELAFSDTDFRVEAVADGREALERLATLRPDLVLADVVMPAPSGYELCRRVKESDHPVPVLLLAGTFEPFDEHLARDCGADGHLVKPFESRVLLDRVQNLIERPSAPPPAAAPEPDDTSSDGAPAEFTPAQLEQLTRAVIERLSDRVVREIAWEVVPELAELIVRERLRELEAERSREEV